MLFHVLVTILVLAHVVCAAILLRPSRGWVERAMIVIAVLSLMVGLFLTLARIFSMPMDVWNEARLANSIALLKGYSLYGSPGQGPMEEYLYGPVGATAYLPAAVFSRYPTIALLIGGVLSGIYFYIPAAMFMRKAAPAASGAMRVAAFVIFVAATNLSQTLPNASTWIHTDAPALGLAACALTFLLDGRSMVAMICGALAVWTKQTFAPLVIVLPILGWILHDRRCALRDALMLVVALVALGSIFASLFGPRAMLFQMLIEPMHLPWQRIEMGRSNAVRFYLWEFWQVAWPFILLLGAPLVVRKELVIRCSREWLKHNPWALPTMLAIAIAPTAFLAWIKAGGENNNAAGVTYFLLLAGCSALAGPRTDTILIKAIVVIFAAHLTARAFFDDDQLDWRLKVARDPWNNSTEIAVRYERAHPGEVYFPWNLQASLVGSGKLYHFDYAVHDRIISGYPPTDEEIRAHLPPNMRAVAYPPAIVPSMEMLAFLKEYDRPIHIPELPGFVIFGRKEQP
jgi:hypothetical protein